jgi:hypothetical protein
MADPDRIILLSLTQVVEAIADYVGKHDLVPGGRYENVRVQFSPDGARVILPMKPDGPVKR